MKGMEARKRTGLGLWLVALDSVGLMGLAGVLFAFQLRAGGKSVLFTVVDCICVCKMLSAHLLIDNCSLMPIRSECVPCTCSATCYFKTIGFTWKRG